ncbi:hypothetical protein [Spirilliplanes yamanashiensis]|nr:hypothetical protein [Spirilliplanes yamanashiensis]MDP9819980.1 hypothetical protein [Spirilliplanes yamanashiensis]
MADPATGLPVPADRRPDAAGYPAEQLLAAAHAAARPLPAPGEVRPGRNSAADRALAFGIASLVINFAGLVSVAAIVWGVAGLNRTRQGPAAGRATAAWGVLLGVVGLVFTARVKHFLF